MFEQINVTGIAIGTLDQLGSKVMASPLYDYFSLKISTVSTVWLFLDSRSTYLYFSGSDFPR